MERELIHCEVRDHIARVNHPDLRHAQLRISVMVVNRIGTS
jgi:hypothetical protein